MSNATLTRMQYTIDQNKFASLLSLSRLHGWDPLPKVRVIDLRFTPNEAAILFDQVMCLGLAEKSLPWRRAPKGGIVGLQIAA